MTTLIHAPSVELQVSEWETDFFTARMGALKAHNRGDGVSAAEASMADDFERAVAQARRENYAHLIFRATSDDLAAIWAAERAGFRLVDVGIDSTFSFVTTPLPEPRTPVRVREGRPDDLPVLRTMTTGAFNHTRFSVDPFFTREQVDAFYQRWVTNLFDGLADVVLVAELDSKPAGFISCAKQGDEGRIPLVATASEVRGSGIGRNMVAAALRWFSAAGTRVAHVKTQAANYPALALYHRSGFTISTTELTFSITLRASGSQYR